MRTTDMTSGNPTRLMLRFALPVIITNLGQQFYMIADAAIVGRGIGVDALAAVGCTDWTYWVVLWSITSMTQGFATFVSRYFGKQDYKMMNKSITMSSLLSLIIAAVFTLLGLTLARPVLVLLGTPEAILGDAVTYLSTMLAGTVAVTGYNLSASVLRAFGDGKSPLIAMIIAALMNIALDLIFVIALGMGVFGAALASVISQAVAFFFCTIRIFGIECVKLDKDAWKLDLSLAGRLTTFGLPLALQYAVINIGGMIVQSTVNLQGAGFIAGYTAVSKLYGILESTAVSLGASFTTFVSQNFGAGNYKRVRKGVLTCIIIAISAALVIMAIVLPLNGVLPRFFIDQSEAGAAEALEVGAHYLVNMTLCLPILYLVYVYRSHFQSIGDSMWSMISGFGEAASRILMVKVLFTFLGNEVLFFIEPVAWLAALLFVMVPYYIYRNNRLPKE